MFRGRNSDMIRSCCVSVTIYSRDKLYPQNVSIVAMAAVQKFKRVWMRARSKEKLWTNILYRLVKYTDVRKKLQFNSTLKTNNMWQVHEIILLQKVTFRYQRHMAWDKRICFCCYGVSYIGWVSEPSLPPIDNSQQISDFLRKLNTSPEYHLPLATIHA